MDINPFLKDVASVDFDRCSNAELQSEIDTFDDYRFETLEERILKIKIRNCRNLRCLKAKARIATSSPDCKWAHFRDWVLVVMSCTSNLAQLSEEDIFYRRNKTLPTAIHICFATYAECRDRDFREIEGVDVFSTCEVLYWVAVIVVHFNVPPDVMHYCFRQYEVEASAIRHAVGAVPDLRVCQRRLWNLVNASERKVIDLPTISSMIRNRLPAGHQAEKHEQCTPELCLLDDDNTTRVLQRHKCNRPTLGGGGREDYDWGCDGDGPGEIVFPLELINNVVTSDFSPTAWAIQRKPFDLHCSKYMAISHAWADGTGVGLKQAGTVNRCLFNFFVDIAQKLGCDGIWWDTICMPTTRDKKAIAMNMMNLNYNKAHCTLVHDEALVNFDWKDDGSPCLALALSTWFSRGWTAMELWESRTVKVVFRNPETREPIVKDLVKDVLAQPRDFFAHLGHRVVSEVIRRLLRTSRIKEHKPDMILSVLKPRYTSWTRDRLFIAGLMARVDGFSSTWSKPKVTQSILLQSGTISQLNLLHGQTTMSSAGPWSWCPISLLDLYTDDSSGHLWSYLDVADDGTVIGGWKVVPLDQGEVFSPASSHVSVQLRIAAALRNLKRCLLLFPATYDPNSLKGRCLLATNLGTTLTQGNVVRRCEYVGTVMARAKVSSQSSERGRYIMEVVELGSREPASAEVKDHCGLTALHWAAIEGQEEAAEKLLLCGASINLQDDHGMTPLDWAQSTELARPPKGGDGLIRLLKMNGGLAGTTSFCGGTRRDSYSTEFSL